MQVSELETQIRTTDFGEYIQPTIDKLAIMNLFAIVAHPIRPDSWVDSSFHSIHPMANGKTMKLISSLFRTLAFL